MLPTTKTPTTGRLITLGREPLGQFAGKIIAFEHVVGKSRHHFASFSDSKCDGVKGGARFTASACKMVVGLIIGNIETGGRSLPVQWPDLSSDYEKEKEKYAGDKGQWRLTDTIINRIHVQKRWGEAGRSVGVFGQDQVPKISFGVMYGWPATKSIRPSQYAFWNEFGTDPTKYSGGQPPRPVFIPTYQQFARKYLPTLANAICESLEEDYERLKKNINKPGGKFIGEKITGPKEFFGDIVTGPTQFIKPPKADKYEKKFREQMASSGADKWLAAHGKELKEFED
jgi:hypothetical protein